MVSEKKVKQKLPELLVDGKVSSYPNFRLYQKRRRALTKIERKRPTLFNHYFSRVVKALDDFERMMKEAEFEF